MNAAPSLIHLDNVSKVFYTDEVETHALDDVTLDIFSGEYLVPPKRMWWIATTMSIGLLAALPGVVIAQTRAEDRAPRTPWGAPDLRGTWSLETMTPLERPPGLEDQPRLTGTEADAFLDGARSRFRQALDAALSADVEFGDGGASESVLDYPLLDGRTSLVVSPSSGRIPRTPVGQQRAAETSARMSGTPNGPEDRAMDERCLMAGSLPLGRGFGAVFVQTPDHLVIYHEFINATIIVPLDDRPPPAEAIRQWTGVSRGSWDGDTLVVETTNFDPRRGFQGSGTGLRLVQRFRRVDQDILDYSYTVEDPESFTEPWSVEFPLTNRPAPIYEMACHEGNRSMPLLLSGARAEERAATFVGAFRLVSFERLDEGTKPDPPFSDGMLSYGASGRVLLQLTNPDRPDRYLAYYGRYDVNVHQGVVRHYVEQGSRPGLRDRTLALEYELPDDDTLILLLRGDDDVGGRATWQRHR